MKEDLEFLAKINTKLHFVSESHGSGHWASHTFHIDHYTDKKMSEEEIKKLLDISKKNNYIIYPINTAMGFSVGYDICEIQPDSKRKVLLRFKEGQLPEKYNFKKLSKTFMREENLKKAEMIGEKIVNDYDHYDY